MEPEAWKAPLGDRIPNNPKFPVLLYRGVEGATEGPEAIRALFARHGWGGSWIDASMRWGRRRRIPSAGPAGPSPAL
jgi:uncharacterized protein YjlB